MIVPASVRLPFSYAAGEAGSRFLEALRDRRAILGSPCPSCGRVLVPARSFCPGCFVPTGEGWVEVGPGGELIAATRVPPAPHGPDGLDGGFGLVRLDGADTAMVHRLLGRVERGERVRAVFREERCGSILDIAGFERMGGRR